MHLLICSTCYLYCFADDFAVCCLVPTALCCSPLIAHIYASVVKSTFGKIKTDTPCYPLPKGSWNWGFSITSWAEPISGSRNFTWNCVVANGNNSRTCEIQFMACLASLCLYSQKGPYGAWRCWKSVCICAHTVQRNKSSLALKQSSVTITDEAPCAIASPG